MALAEYRAIARTAHAPERRYGPRLEHGDAMLSVSVAEYDIADVRPLVGRRTYELFAGSWGAVEDPGINPVAAALNSRPEYVASTTLNDPRWANTTVLSNDAAAAVSELKSRAGGELQVHGSGALTRWLLDNDLVDELNLFVFPVVVGQGTRLFPDTGRDTAPELVESRATPIGVTIQVYRPTGPPAHRPTGPPAHRPPADRNVHGRHEAREIAASSRARTTGGG